MSWSRFWRQQRSGSGALMLAVGVLAGVMMATITGGNDTVTVGSGGDAAAAASPSGAGDTSGFGAGAPVETPGTSAGSSMTIAGGGSSGSVSSSGGAASSPASPVTSGGGTAVGGAAASGGCSGNSGASARGVTATSIKLGVAYLDLAALSSIPQFKITPADKTMGAIYAGWKKRGEIPICGRDVKLDIVTYNVLNPEDQRAACQKLVKDHQVFAAVGHSVFTAGAECVAKDEKTPMIIDDPMPEATMRQAPDLFSLSFSIDTMSRNLVYFAKSKGTLDGKKLGMYYYDDNDANTLRATTIKATLQQLGYTLVAEQKTTTAPSVGGTPGPDDVLAVRRFQTAGVQTAFLLGTAGNFMSTAQQQGYKAQYLADDYSVGASNTTASALPPDQYDGTWAMTGTRREEYTTGSLSPQGQQCLDDYAAFTGDRIDTKKRESEWGALSITCDILNAALEGLKRAGGNLTQQTYMAGLESVRDVPFAMQGYVNWGPGHHSGGTVYRTLLWRKDWAEYRIQQPFQYQRLWVS